MATTRYGSVKGRVARLIRLDACGAPVPGLKSYLVTAGYIKADVAMNYEDGEEIIIKNAWGDLCVNEKDAPRLKNVGLSLDFCQVDPDAWEIVTGARLLLDGSDAKGWALGEDPADGGWSLELWSKAPGTAGCEGSGQLYVYTAFPYVTNGKMGNFTIENGAATFNLAGETKGANELWTIGPGLGGAGAEVSNKALTSNVATITTAAPHGFIVGQQVRVAGVDATFDGTYTITVVGSATTFSYAKTAANVASVADTGVAADATSWLPGIEEILEGEHIAQAVTTVPPPAETLGATELAA